MNLIKRIIIVLFSAALILYCSYSFIQRRNNDKEAPVIAFDSDTIYAGVGASPKELLQGVTASDNMDGDVTSSLIVEKTSKFIAENKKLITYAAFDSHNNVAKATRELIYTDYHSPRFSLEEPLSYNLGSSIDILDRIKAYDCIDGDISDKIKISFSNPTAAGVYTANFRVTNSSGDTSELSAEVNVYEADRNTLMNTPVITLSDYLIYVEKGDKVNPSEYFKGVTLGGKKYNTRYSELNVVNEVDTSMPGLYTISYSITLRGYKGDTELLVVVE